MNRFCGFTDVQKLTDFDGNVTQFEDRKLVTFNKAAVFVNDKLVEGGEDWILGFISSVNPHRGNTRFGYFKEDDRYTERIFTVMSEIGLVDVLVVAPGRGTLTLVGVK